MTQTAELPDSRRWASRAETARYLGCSLRTICRRIADGDIKTYRFGSGSVRIDLNEVDQRLGGAA